LDFEYEVDICLQSGFCKNDERTRFVAVLEVPPVVSAETAVRVQIVKDFKRPSKLSHKD
jgi:hypothetical protein